LWETASDDTLAPRDRVVVQEIDGLTLRVIKDKGVKA
jgi:membrane protein implicated in regulation of membrane protease activity